MPRRIGVHAAYEDLELRHDARQVLLVAADEGERAHPLAVQAHVLGVGLADEALEALLDDEADGVGVALGVAAGEALVGQVEEGQELAALKGARQSVKVSWVTGRHFGHPGEIDLGVDSEFNCMRFGVEFNRGQKSLRKFVEKFQIGCS